MLPGTLPEEIWNWSGCETLGVPLSQKCVALYYRTDLVARPPESLERLREVSNLPVLLLTAKDTVEDRVTGLDLGADVDEDFASDAFDGRTNVGNAIGV